MIEITFDAQTQEFVCVSADGQVQVRLPARGLAKEDLMGELKPCDAVAPYQLLLPFSREAWRKTASATLSSGTTL